MLRSKIAATTVGVGMALALLVGTPPASADVDVLSVGEQGKIKVLKDGKAIYRDAPGLNGDRYSYKSTSARWSVLSADPEHFLDVTLQLFGNQSMTQLLSTSAAGSWITEFVAVDSTHRPLGSLYPRVTSPNEYYDYAIEQVQGTGMVLDGSYAIPMGGDSAAVRDTFMEAGKSYRFTLIPGPYMQGGLFIMGSNPADPTSWVQSREQSLKRGTAGINDPIILDFTAPRTDVYGLVFLSEDSSGTFTLIRAPLP